ncbi:PemI family protein [Enterococcus sp. 2F9_DIV0599]|nr:PemI family protein [Enterococcus sp. 2F9_DIV0599]
MYILSRDICYTMYIQKEAVSYTHLDVYKRQMYIQKEVSRMEMLPIKKWGNSNGLRLPKHIMEYLGIHTDDKVKIIQEEVNGHRRLIIEAANSENELTIEELFENYTAERNHVEIQHLGEAVGNEKW